MPKGTVPEREVNCRACGEPFRSTNVGRAAFYCHGQACDERRAATGFRVAVKGHPPGRLRLPPVARDIMRHQAARERERERFERQWRHEVDRWLASRERRLQRVEARRLHLEAAQRARRVAREIARRERELERERQRARDQAARLRPRVLKAAGEADELRRRLGDLERAAGIPPSGRLVPPPAMAEVVVERSPVDDELLGEVAALLADRPLEPEPGRHELQRAVVGLANARGLGPTRQALRRLAVEALAWERRLPATTRIVRGIDTDAEDVAA